MRFLLTLVLTLMLLSFFCWADITQDFDLVHKERGKIDEMVTDLVKKVSILKDLRVEIRHLSSMVGSQAPSVCRLFAGKDSQGKEKLDELETERTRLLLKDYSNLSFSEDETLLQYRLASFLDQRNIDKFFKFAPDLLKIYSALLLEEQRLQKEIEEEKSNPNVDWKQALKLHKLQISGELKSTPIHYGRALQFLREASAINTKLEIFRTQTFEVEKAINQGGQELELVRKTYYEKFKEAQERHLKNIQKFKLQYGTYVREMIALIEQVEECKNALKLTDLLKDFENVGSNQEYLLCF